MLRFTQILAPLLAVGLLVSCESTSSPFEGPEGAAAVVD